MMTLTLFHRIFLGARVKRGIAPQYVMAITKGRFLPAKSGPG
jgi:hypothetical protein